MARHKNGATGLVRPHSGIYCFFSCPDIIYYIYKNIHSVNLHKNINTYLCNIPYCNLDTNVYNKREEEIKMKHTLTSEKILAAISVLETVVDVLKVISEHMKNEQNDDSKFVESAD